MSSIFEGKTVLITGGTGSIGKELARKILRHNPKAIRIFDNNEAAEFEMEAEFASDRLRLLLGDVRDKDRLDFAMEGVDIVFHLAAMKHVYLSEYNPFETIKTNIHGMQNLIEICLKHNVEKVVFTSSDKAVNPCSVMGATKLLAERLISSANYYKGKRRTTLSSVRFGNVMNSRGSLIPAIGEQVKTGSFVTITDDRMTRFIMFPDQAVSLIIKAAEIMVGGEVFVLKMPTLKIRDLIEVIVEKAAPKHGKRPADIEMKRIGPRPGEKLYEELLTEREKSMSLETDDMYILLPEIEDLLKSYSYSYPGSRKAGPGDYNSSDSRHLSKKEIGDLLLKEGMLA